jgi:protocatechuate 3,4-dioxygenase alpha subunit
MALILTPSQTIGPFFHRALLATRSDDLTACGSKGQWIVIEGRVLDGDHAPVSDAMVEIWQANAAGCYDHAEDSDTEGRPGRSLDSGFHGFGRVTTDSEGRFRFHTIKPGPVREASDFIQAPHINVSIFARGLLKHLATRIYFPDEALNAADPVLNIVPSTRRATLIAETLGDAPEPRFRFEIVLQGTNETVFFEI